MQFVEYQGYGVDLGDFKSDNLQFERAIEGLKSIDVEDIINNETDDVYIQNACNADGFECLVYISAIIPVSHDGGQPTKIYTESEAKDAIYHALEHALKSINTEVFTEDVEDNTEKFLVELKKFVDQDADYSYNNNWSDYI